MLTVKEQLLQEIEQASDALLEETLNFHLFIKQKQRKNPEPPLSTHQPNLLNSTVKPIWEICAEISSTIPDEEWKKLPHDGSINHDHYLYGSRRVEE